MTLIQLLNKIANGEVKDKTKFKVLFGKDMCRKIYYDKNEGNALDCLKNVSDDYPIYDEIGFTDTLIEEMNNKE